MCHTIGSDSMRWPAWCCDFKERKLATKLGKVLVDFNLLVAASGVKTHLLTKKLFFLSRRSESSEKQNLSYSYLFQPNF